MRTATATAVAAKREEAIYSPHCTVGGINQLPPALGTPASRRLSQGRFARDPLPVVKGNCWRSGLGFLSCASEWPWRSGLPLISFAAEWRWSGIASLSFASEWRWSGIALPSFASDGITSLRALEGHCRAFLMGIGWALVGIGGHWWALVGIGTGIVSKGEAR